MAKTQRRRGTDRTVQAAAQAIREAQQVLAGDEMADLYQLQSDNSGPQLPPKPPAEPIHQPARDILNEFLEQRDSRRKRNITTKCPACKGSGKLPKGNVFNVYDKVRDTGPCTNCDGSGKVVKKDVEEKMAPWAQRLEDALYKELMEWWPTSEAARTRSPETVNTQWQHRPSEPVTHWLNIEDFLNERYPEAATGRSYGVEGAQPLIDLTLQRDNGTISPRDAQWLEDQGYVGTGHPITQAFLNLHNKYNRRVWRNPEDRRRTYELMLRHIGPGAKRPWKAAMRRAGSTTPLHRGVGFRKGDLPPELEQRLDAALNGQHDPKLADHLLQHLDRYGDGVGQWWAFDPKDSESYSKYLQTDAGVSPYTDHADYGRSDYQIVMRGDWGGDYVYPEFFNDPHYRRLQSGTPVTVRSIRVRKRYPGEESESAFDENGNFRVRGDWTELTPAPGKPVYAHKTAAEELRFEYRPGDEMFSPPSVIAHSGNYPVGKLTWYPDNRQHMVYKGFDADPSAAPGKIHYITVDESFRHKGIATQMFDWAKQNARPDLAHSTNLTGPGAGWAAHEQARHTANIIHASQKILAGWKVDPNFFGAVHEMGHVMDAVGGFQASDNLHSVLFPLYRAETGNEISNEVVPGKPEVSARQWVEYKNWLRKVLPGRAFEQNGFNAREAIASAFVEHEVNPEASTPALKALHGLVVEVSQAAQRPTNLTTFRPIAKPPADIDPEDRHMWQSGKLPRGFMDGVQHVFQKYPQSRIVDMVEPKELSEYGDSPVTEVNFGNNWLNKPRLNYDDRAAIYPDLLEESFQRQHKDGDISPWMWQADDALAKAAAVIRFAEGYSTVHERVRKEKGAPSSHKCVDCGKSADHWTYDHSSDSEKTKANDSLPYSSDTSHYTPRCMSCHNKLDAKKASMRTAMPVLVLPRNVGIKRHRYQDASVLKQEVVKQNGAAILWKTIDSALPGELLYVARDKDGKIHGVGKAMDIGTHHVISDLYTGLDAPNSTGTKILRTIAQHAKKKGQGLFLTNMLPSARKYWEAMGATTKPDSPHAEFSPEAHQALIDKDTIEAPHTEPNSDFDLMYKIPEDVRKPGSISTFIGPWTGSHKREMRQQRRDWERKQAEDPTAWQRQPFRIT